VTARAECTARSMFKRLRHEIGADVAMRSKYLSESQKSNGLSFSVEDQNDDSFVVYRKGLGLAGTVSFGIIGPSLVAIDGAGGTMEATIGMNDSGRCMLRVPRPDNSGKVTGHYEIETWQFRKKALEGLFFPSASLSG
jgi:hypothetical protein